MTDALRRILRIVEEEYGIPFDEDSVDVAHFVTHRLLIERNRQRQQTPVPTTVAGGAVLLETVRIKRPRQYASAQRIAALLEAIYSWPATATSCSTPASTSPG